MDDRETLLVCYRSGQISAAQWERHCEDDPELRTMVETKGGDANDGDGPSERSDGQNRPVGASPGVKAGATDPIAAMREALKDIAVYGCGMLSQPAAMNGPEESWLRMRIAAYEQRARAALVAYDAAAPSRHSVPNDLQTLRQAFLEREQK